MTTALSAYLNRLDASQLATITYETGFDASLTVSSASFNTYIGDTESTFQTGLQIGATVTFSFDPNAGFSAGQQDYAAQALAIWSGMCGINFVYTSNAGSAQVVFAKAGTVYNGNTLASGTYYDPLQEVGTTTTGLKRTVKALIVLDTSGAYGDFASYSVSAGYGIDTLVHEVGHLVDLGHTGPYNGTVIPATDQNNSTDVRTWSIMSYIQPTDTSAKYYGSYDPTGVNFGSGGGAQRAPYTPMGLDIFAAQRLEGVSTNSMFAGGQTFGFNSNVTFTNIAGTAALLSMYDFTVDTAPVVTLYDTGTGNTFDISGFSNDATVNLNDGTFSSIAGLSDNIFIEYGTRIDTLVGGAGNDVITVNADSDVINGGGGSNTVVFLGTSVSYTIVMAAGIVTVSAAGVTDTLTNIQTLTFNDLSISTSSIACFLRGTRIRTPRGDVAVQHLAIGDAVLTADGAQRAIRWLGRRRYRLRPGEAAPEIQPVLVRQGALADGVPARDLLVSPQHALLLDGSLVPAIALVNGVSITQDARVGVVAYYHVELDRHDVILAEAAPAESFADHDSRMMFENAASYGRLYPGAPAQAAPYPAPRLSSGAALQAIWQRLAEHAGAAERAGAVAPQTGTAGPLRGNLEMLSGGRVEGWAFDPDQPGHPVALEIAHGDAVIATILANGWRADLVRAGLGAGRCAFALDLPHGIRPDGLSVRRARDGMRLPGSPA